MLPLQSPVAAAEGGSGALEDEAMRIAMRTSAVRWQTEQTEGANCQRPVQCPV